MLRALTDLESYTIAATDGDVGNVSNFLVDDEKWTVRYLVASTGRFFGGRRVLISPMSFRQADWATKSFHVQLTMDKVKHAPGIDTDQSVSRQHEARLSDHYQYPSYWGLDGLWGMSDSPASLATVTRQQDLLAPCVATGDRRLRSVNEVRGYRVQGSDDEIGHIEDFIVDDATWEMKYLVIDTSNWFVGKRVLVAPQWASRISWAERVVFFRETRNAIRNSPEWNLDAPINQAYETRLHDHYGRPAREPVVVPIMPG